ncbi:MAG: DOMON-like domain-containing protein [Azoarcus sp.]|nr:DOMON-like domain-containing protein [Azoarcus sp.]
MTTLPTSAPKIPTITVSLRPFAPPEPDPPPAVSTLLATISALPSGSLRFRFALEGRISALRVPAADAPPSGALWQHTCFEAFISTPDGENYREFNFSPAGQWAASKFLHYREIGHTFSEEKPAAVSVTSECHENRLTLTAEVPPSLLYTSPILRLGLAAVVEFDDGNIEYWALCHPAERPDFHHANGWTLRLDTRLAKQ